MLAQTAPPTKQWDRSVGSKGDDALNKLRQTPDGGYILAGISAAGISGDKSQVSQGDYDYWVVKVDANGQKQWDRTFGGPAREELTSVVLTADGGYLLAGNARSDKGGDKSQLTNGQSDYWLVKLDATGTKQWDRAFGGRDEEYLGDICLTQDGGYLLGGRSESGKTGDRSQPNLGVSDYWVVKIDAAGTKQWDRAYGTVLNDYLTSLKQTSDGGYILGGYTYGGISGDKTQAPQGEQDYWIVKVDALGAKQWDRAFGGAINDYLTSLQQTTDGGYILGGWSNSGVSSDKSDAGTGRIDYWVIKTDAAGSKQWDRAIGRVNTDYLHELQQTTDGGYILGGEVYFSPTGNYNSPGGGNWDYWLVKLDAAGTREWDQDYGGPQDDELASLQQTADGGFVLGGTSTTNLGGDKTDPGHGGADYWVVKLGVPRIAGDPNLCAGGQVLLTAPTGATSYRWSTGASTAAITVTQPGTYGVVCTYPDGHTLTLQQQVSTFAPPTPLIAGDTLLCAGTTQQLTAAAAGATGYRWSTGATTAAITVTQPGTYGVVATFGSGCTSSAQLRLRQRPTIAAFGLGADTTLCEGGAAILRAPHPTGAGISYRWSDGSTGPTLRVTTAGTYSLQLLGCGSQTASRNVAVKSCLLIGNVITPNGDQHNDRFEVVNPPPGDWELAIYNRWGRQVFTTVAYHNEWGEMAAAGIYYYSLRQPATGQAYKGWVEVIR